MNPTWLEAIAAHRERLARLDALADAQASTPTDYPDAPDLEYIDAKTGVKVAVWFKTGGTT